MHNQYIINFRPKRYHTDLAGCRDVLRRHYRSCSQRGHRQIPDRLPRGRRKQACDICARSKVSCDLDLPCENCLFSDAECTHSRTEQNLHRAPGARDCNSAREMHIQTSAENGPNVHKISIPFLLNWTNPNSRLTDTFQRISDDPLVLESTQTSDDTTNPRESGGHHTYVAHNLGSTCICYRHRRIQAISRHPTIF